MTAPAPGLWDSRLAYQLPSQPCLSPIASSSSLAAISTPVDKAECAEIQRLYLVNGLSVELQILQAGQPNMALWVCKILPTWAKVLSSPIASFSTPVDKAEYTKIHKLYLGNGLSVGLQILHGSKSNMALRLCQILATWPKALSSPIASFSTPVEKAECAKIRDLYLGNGLSLSLIHI